LVENYPENSARSILFLESVNNNDGRAILPSGVLQRLRVSGQVQWS